MVNLHWVRESNSIGVRVSLEDGNHGVLGETDMYGLMSGALREEDGKSFCLSKCGFKLRKEGRKVV